MKADIDLQCHVMHCDRNENEIFVGCGNLWSLRISILAEADFCHKLKKTPI